MFSRILSGIWEFPAVLSDPSSQVHLSVLNIPASCPTAMLSFWSHVSPLLQHWPSTQKYEFLRRVSTSLNDLVLTELPFSKSSKSLPSPRLTTHSPSSAGPPPPPVGSPGPGTSPSTSTLSSTRVLPSCLCFKRLGGNSEGRNWSKGTSHPPPATHVPAFHYPVPNVSVQRRG